MAKISKKVTFENANENTYENTFASKENKGRTNKILVSLSDEEYDIFLAKKEKYRKETGMKKNLPDAVFMRHILIDRDIIFHGLFL